MTLKYRPFCSFGNRKVGFRWFTAEDPKPIALSEDAFLKGRIPKEFSKDKFSECCLDQSIWDQLEKDFNEENQLQAISRESLLDEAEVQ